MYCGLNDCRKAQIKTIYYLTDKDLVLRCKNRDFCYFIVILEIDASIEYTLFLYAAEYH